MVATVEIKGLNATIKNLNKISKQLGGGLKVPMKRAVMIVAASAKRKAPVDTGKLRASIAPEVKAFGDSVTGIVGSNLVYAPFMEEGTSPHFPPISALEVWARRHGISAFLVARAIARRGLKARNYLKKALSENTQKIKREFENFVSKVTRENG